MSHENKVKVNVEHYEKLICLMRAYDRAFDQIKDMEESIEEENVYSVKFAKFEIEQNKAKLVWIRDEVDRLCNE